MCVIDLIINDLSFILEFNIFLPHNFLSKLCHNWMLSLFHRDFIMDRNGEVQHTHHITRHTSSSQYYLFLFETVIYKVNDAVLDSSGLNL